MAAVAPTIGRQLKNTSAKRIHASTIGSNSSRPPRLLPETLPNYAGMQAEQTADGVEFTDAPLQGVPATSGGHQIRLRVTIVYSLRESQIVIYCDSQAGAGLTS
jgi:hypothetical protein